MSMIKCPECGKEVSDKANVCPNCGISLFDLRKKAIEEDIRHPKTIKGKILTFLYLFVFGLIITFVGLFGAALFEDIVKHIFEHIKYIPNAFIYVI